MLYLCHVDDSSDGKQEEYTIACSLTCSLEGWTDANIRWESELRRNPRIGYFHTKECSSLTGEFQQFRDNAKWPKPSGSEAANTKKERLMEIMRESEVQVFAIAVDLPGYNRVKAAYPESMGTFGNGPFEAAFQSLLYESGKQMERETEDGVIGFVCDEHNNAVEHANLYVQFKKKNPITAKRLVGIGMFDDKHLPSLQMADLAANMLNKIFRANPVADKLPGPFPEFGERLWKIARFTESYALEILEGNGVKIKSNDDGISEIRRTDEQSPQSSAQRNQSQAGSGKGSKEAEEI